MHIVTRLQVFQSNINNFQTVNRKTLTHTTTVGQNGLMSNDNKEVLHMPQGNRTEASSPNTY